MRTQSEYQHIHPLQVLKAVGYALTSLALLTVLYVGTQKGVDTTTEVETLRYQLSVMERDYKVLQKVYERKAQKLERLESTKGERYEDEG
jgi:hypothetical protein